MTLYSDRKHAGRELSDFIKDKIEADLVVIPYAESYDVGVEVAEDQGADIAFRLSDFLSSPNAPYAEFGAVTEDGTIWIDDRLIKELNVSNTFIEKKSRRLSKQLKKESRSLAEDENRSKNLSIIIVSDGIGSGFREAAVAGSLLKEGFKDISIATPSKSINTRADLNSISGRIFCLHNIAFLSSSDAIYDTEMKKGKKGFKDFKSL